MEEGNFLLSYKKMFQIGGFKTPSPIKNWNKKSSGKNIYFLFEIGNNKKAPKELSSEQIKMMIEDQLS